jgi:hypothetical protein
MDTEVVAATIGVSLIEYEHLRGHSAGIADHRA